MTVEGFWEQIGRWAISAASAIAIAFVALIRWWVGTRFDEIDGKLEDHETRISKHDAQLAAINVHIAKAEEGRKEQLKAINDLDKKLDRLIERAG